jgi:Zn-dependent alcohol dehydrogenase
MSTFSKAQRIKIALGGFVSFTGVIILGCAVLTATGTVDLASILQNELSVALVSIVGVLNVVCGLILILRDKEIVLSFAAHQKKTNNHANQPGNNP